MYPRAEQTIAHGGKAWLPLTRKQAAEALLLLLSSTTNNTNEARSASVGKKVD